MKEQILRETIRKEIRKSLKEVDYQKGTADAIANVENQPGIKMLKRALAKGGPDEQAAGLLKVINAVSGGSTAVKNKLRMLLAPKGALDTPTEEPVTEAPDKTELRMGQFKDAFKTQMKGKSAKDQMELVIGLVKDLDLKGNKQTFVSKLGRVLKAK